MFHELGAAVISADELAREAAAPGSSGLSAIVAHFGAEFLQADGSLDRKKLGAHVFQNAVARKELEGILHPSIRELAAQHAAAALAKRPPLLVYDVPLLFESGLDSAGFMAIVVVIAPKELCLTRTNFPAAEAERRWSTQLPPEEKARRADHVIKNDGSLEDLRKQVEHVFRKLSAIAAGAATR